MWERWMNQNMDIFANKGPDSALLVVAVSLPVENSLCYAVRPPPEQEGAVLPLPTLAWARKDKPSRFKAHVAGQKAVCLFVAGRGYCQNSAKFLK